MTPTLGEGSLWDLEPFVEPLDSLLDPGRCTLVYDGTLLLEQGPNLLPAEDTAAWLVGGLVTGDEHRVAAGDPCQPSETAATLQSLVPGMLPTVQPLAPGAQGAGLATFVPSCEWSDLAGLPCPESASSGASGLAMVEPAIGALADATHSSSQLQQQPQQRRQLVGGSTPRQQRGRGRPRIDRSQMTDKQLKSIRNAQNNNERKVGK